MQKIVTNRCHGGYGLSQKAVLRYAELKGVIVYPEQECYFTTYWVKGGYAPRHPGKQGRVRFDVDDIARDDPLLIQVVKELGAAAFGGHAKLEITEIPDGVEWQICEYDGLEWVAEAHRAW